MFLFNHHFKSRAADARGNHTRCVPACALLDDVISNIGLVHRIPGQQYRGLVHRALSRPEIGNVHRFYRDGNARVGYGGFKPRHRDSLDHDIVCTGGRHLPFKPIILDIHYLRPVCPGIAIPYRIVVDILAGGTGELDDRLAPVLGALCNRQIRHGIRYQVHYLGQSCRGL